MSQPREITDGIINGVVFEGPIPESDADTDWQPHPDQYPRSDWDSVRDRLRDGQYLFSSDYPESMYYSNPYEYREHDRTPDDMEDAIRYARQQVVDAYQDDLRWKIRYAAGWGYGG